MTRHLQRRRFGFAIIEALIALLLVGIGLLAVSRLQTLGILGSGEAKARTEAAHLSQQQLETLRNIVLRSGFTALANGSTTKTGNNASYAIAWTVTTPNAALEQRLVQLRTTWTDASGRAQQLDLNTLIAWDDPGMQARFAANPTANLIQPTGDAQRGSGQWPGWPTVPQGATANADGSYTYTDASGKTFLLSNGGQILLSLPPKNGSPQSFTTISGRVMFDQTVNSGSIPPSNKVRVRLSSEGECVFDNATLQSSSVSDYRSFRYTCYVGPGWYGNVAVTVDDGVTGQAASPTVCVGDPGFNGGASNSTLVSAHSDFANVRSYRGFRSAGNGLLLPTGVQGGTRYGQTFGPGGTALTGPFDGAPKPSDYPSFYAGVSAGAATDFFNQDFLITRLSGNSNCASKMAAGNEFRRNAGRYVCITPDAVAAAADVCPAVWPSFEGEVGNGGSINYTLQVEKAGTGGGTVNGSPATIACGSVCATSVPTGTVVTLVAQGDANSQFTGWDGCTTQSGSTCTVTVSTGRLVTATFVNAPNTLAVTTAGSGTGSVSSGDGRIACNSNGAGGTGQCSKGYAAGATVTLTATPSGGSTFTGWSGACTGTSACTLTMDAAKDVTATFAPPASGNALNVTIAGSGSGTVISAPAGINCTSGTCSATYGTSTSVTLTATATPGSSFGGWSGACSGTGACTVTMSAVRNVTATFATSTTCITPVSGAARDKNGSVTASPSTFGSCSMAGGNSSNYSCSFNAPAGTQITLTNARTNGNPTYSYTLSITANCTAQTGVSFPQQ